MTMTTANSLRVLSLDGGGMKGYTSLLILKRIFRTMVSEGSLSEEPKPCEVFDLIAGTSTGGLIAIMLGRLHMSIDQCLREYEETGGAVFQNSIASSKLGKIFKSASGSAFYDICKLQTKVKEAVSQCGIEVDQSFNEDDPSCKVVVCVTRLTNSRPDLLRNYIAVHPTQENYDCTIWEAASATAAAPMFFKPVVFRSTKDSFGDGGMRRNNPINEAINEVNRLTEKEWAGRQIGCVVSIGTGAVEARKLSNGISELLKGAVAIMTDSEDIADQFNISELGQTLDKSKRYFRFNVPQGLQMLKMDEWTETERMRAFTTDYLQRYQSGNIVKTCAQSLLDPDKNLNAETRSKPSLLRDRPCLHFVNRGNLLTQIRTFFHPFKGGCSIFVLSGMAGVGKTQLALRFAEISMQHMSVLWIRADNFTNFARDYSQILTVVFSSVEGAADPSNGLLMRTRAALESKPADWLLVLDNADDLQEFRKSIQGFLPREGRVLITTRDRRFQGGIAAASNGCFIEPMSDSEAMALLRKSVPNHLIHGQTLDESAHSIVNIVGNLPLAIAQAAANILEQDMPISQFAEDLAKQSEITARLSEPVRDFMNSDERNGLQSVTTTWNMSFNLLKESNSTSIILLGYMACFNNSAIPCDVLRSLPDFDDVDETQFSQSLGKLHQLCLAERVSLQNTAITQMHPLVHEIAWKTICQTDPKHWLDPTIFLVCRLFPLVGHEKDPQWDLCSYLAPHALRMVQLGQECDLISKPFARLMQCLSCYLNASGEHTYADSLASAALNLALDVWGEHDPSTLYVLKIKVECLEALFRNEEAIKLLQAGLSFLTSEDIKAHISELEILEERYILTDNLGRLFRKEDLYLEASKVEQELLGELAEGKRIWTEKLQDPSEAPIKTGDLTPFQKDTMHLATDNPKSWIMHIHRYNVAHDLCRCGQQEESLRLTESILAEVPPDGFKDPHLAQFYYSMLNNKAHCLERREPSTSLHIFHKVFKESLVIFGIVDRDVWVAANNVLRCYLQDPHIAASTWAELLDAALKPGMKLPRAADLSSFLETLDMTYRQSHDWATHLLCEDKHEEARIFSEKIERVKKEFARSLVYGGKTKGLDHLLHNSRGVYLQWYGHFKLAEEYHRTAIAKAIEAGFDGDISVYRYNVMLALARQGKMEDALSYRSEHSVEVAINEKIYGTLEERLAKDLLDKEVYDQASERLRRGEQYKDGEWWEKIEGALQRAELRYGKLMNNSRPPPAKAEQSNEIETDIGHDTGNFRQRLRRFKKPFTIISPPMTTSSPRSNSGDAR